MTGAARGRAGRRIPGIGPAALGLVGIAAGGALAVVCLHHRFYAASMVALAGALVQGAFVLGRMARLEQRLAERAVPVRVAPPRVDQAVVLRAMLDHAPVPLLGVTHDGVLVASNRAARRLFGTDDRVLDPPAALMAGLARLKDGGRLVVRLDRPGGGDAGGAGNGRHYALSVALGSLHGRYARLVALTDIEAELNAGEATALREILQVLSHEIMNSLTPVSSLAESAQEMLAAGDAAAMPEAAQALATILRRVQGLDRFVQGYRHLARLPAVAPRQMSVAAMLRDAGRLFASRWDGQGVALRLDVPVPDIVAWLDGDLLVQALIALMTNGAQAALAGPRRPAWVALWARADADHVTIGVGDSGAGVAPDQAALIFRPFFSLREGGTGIGLSVARQIVQDHGGSLVLAPPAEDAGATFLIRI
ncbi:sensor histidine kinase [Gluconacetobacter diazotrophicus]|uniref:histidine kinase n=1 Tax=Gluconacetobacter diazotrophicus (strain ATCC 49037 / DSM 5601 / CCUG 37298 / CIP 103539 / LMG 7603 / PAl5) TaxID=272568 RepID=A9H7P7_GLUDA|nr:ATP-binding protein [Gluconacetobacter diazotrophicus]CAP57668.1 Two-component system, sensor histidine kinase [Gluconacetobacter diazotrophicus PA1 5]